VVRGRTLPRKELHEAAEQLTASQAGLIAVGEPTIEKGLDEALTRAAKVVKRTVEATTGEMTSELQGRSRADAAAAVEGGFGAVLSAGLTPDRDLPAPGQARLELAPP
jgi:hypothetical protein